MNISTEIPGFEIRPASEDDVPIILSFIKELAEYERLSHEVIATEDSLRVGLFGERRFAEVVIGCLEHEPVGFALHAPGGGNLIRRRILP